MRCTLCFACAQKTIAAFLLSNARCDRSDDIFLISSPKPKCLADEMVSSVGATRGASHGHDWAPTRNRFKKTDARSPRSLVLNRCFYCCCFLQIVWWFLGNEKRVTMTQEVRQSIIYFFAAAATVVLHSRLDMMFSGGANFIKQKNIWQFNTLSHVIHLQRAT